MFQYYAHRKQLRTVGRGADLELLNSTALKLAREVADKHGCLMAGNLCNTNVYDKDDLATHETVENMFKVRMNSEILNALPRACSDNFHYSYLL